MKEYVIQTIDIHYLAYNRVEGSEERADSGSCSIAILSNQGSCYYPIFFVYLPFLILAKESYAKVPHIMTWLLGQVGHHPIYYTSNILYTLAQLSTTGKS